MAPTGYQDSYYTATAVGTVLAEGKERHEFDGRTYLMERGLTAASRRSMRGAK